MALTLFALSAPFAGGGESSLDRALQEELERQEGVRKAPGYKKLKLTPAHLKVAPLELPADFKRSEEKFPASAHNVTIGPDGNFLRDGRPVFLFGVEAEMYNGAWLHRILGIDFTELSILARGEFRSSLKVEKKKAPDGKLLLQASSPLKSPWMELRFKEALRGGTLITYDHMINKSFWPLSYKQYKFEPRLYCPGVPGFRKNSSHFFDMCQENPEARQLYVNMLRWNGRHARKYPIWMYELINEVSYLCPCLPNTRHFQAAMKVKFGTIAKANRTWGTKYSSFGKVVPPLNIESAQIYNSRWGMIPHGKALSVPLWIDWARWMEGRAEAVFKDLQAEMKKVDPRARCTFQSPYWQGRNAMSPASKARAEDVYGAEQGLTLFRQTAGKEPWDEIRQMLNQQLSNDLIRASAPKKPSANLEPTLLGYPHDKHDFTHNYVIGPWGMRTFFWHQAVHGVGASVISYFYSDEASHGGPSVWDPRRTSVEAVKEMPRTRNEILSVARIVLPRPRIKGKIGVLYSLESARIVRPEEKNVWRKFGREVLDYYAAATFTRVPVDVLTSRQILAGKADRYALLVLPHAYRVAPGVLEKLSAYVRSGGAVLASPDSLRYEDAFGTRLDTEAFLGGKAGAPVLAGAALAFEGAAKGLPGGPTAGIASVPSGEKNFDFAAPVHGYAFTPTTAKVLGKAGGQAAFSVNTLGRGKVYYLAREPNPTARRACVEWVVKQCGLKPDVDVVFTDALGKKADYVETHRFDQGGRAVFYALNFGGGPRQAKLVPGRTFKGNAAVRNLRSGKYLAPGGKERSEKTAWTPAQLAQGVPVTLPSQDPVVLLIEGAAQTPLALRTFSAEQKEVMKWLYRPSPKADKRVLVDGFYVQEGRVHKWRMPTAVKLLEDHGYEVNSLCGPLPKPLMRTGGGLKQEKLASYNVLLFTGSGGDLSGKAVRRAVDFVRNGGGLLFCPLVEYKNAGRAHPLARAFGIETGRANFYDPKNNALDEPLYVKFTNPAAHPVTKGVKVFQSAGARPLYVKGAKGKAAVLFKGGPSSYTFHPWGDGKKGPGQAVAVALEFGKGRVVVVGGDSWLRPDDLKRGGNEKFFLNIIQWLAKAGSAKP